MWATTPSSNAVITSRSLSGDRRCLNTASTAPLSMFSMIWPSRPSSRLSISILPAVDAASASRSQMRGTTSRSPERRARRTALAASTSLFDTLRRTDTPERWFTWLLWRARWENSATTSSM